VITVDEQGKWRVSLRNLGSDVLLVMRMVFYFDLPHKQVAKSSRSAILGFVDLVPPHSLKTFFDIDGERSVLTHESFRELVWKWYSGPYCDWPNATIRLGGLESEPTPFGLIYWGKQLSNPAYPLNRGFLDAWMPIDFFCENFDLLRAFFSRVSESTGVCSAWCDLSLVGGTQSERQAIAHRFIGIDVSRAKSVSMDLGPSVPGVHWIMYMKSDQVSSLGGLTRLIAEAPTKVEGWEVENGLLLQLAEHPSPGDRNRREVLPAYEWFARRLESSSLLHVPRSGRYFLDKDGMPDLDAQEAWHRRFLASA